MDNPIREEPDSSSNVYEYFWGCSSSGNGSDTCEECGGISTSKVRRCEFECIVGVKKCYLLL